MLSESVKFIPRVGLFWLHEFQDDARTVTASFRDYAATPFTTSGQSPDANRALVEAGMELKFSDMLSAFADYTLDWGEDTRLHTVSAGLSIAF